MKAEQKNAAVNAAETKANETANTTAARSGNRPSLTGKEAKQTQNTCSETVAPAAPEETGNPEEINTNAPVVAETGTEAPAAGEVKPEQVKTEEVKFGAKKFALNLEQTLKSVNDLHRLSIQRLALIGRIQTLEDFEVQLQQEGDELESNPYQSCKLIIRDDRGREFVTNTPNLIRMVSQYIFEACHQKLADIEANIVFPQS